MSNLHSISAARIDGQDVSLGEILHCLKLTGGLGFVRQALADLIVQRRARTLGLEVSDADVQAEVNSLRKQLKLFKAAQTQEWLKEHHLTLDDLAESAEWSLLKSRLKERVVTRDQVELYFSEHRRSFDRVQCAHILVEDEGVAEELKVQLVEDGADFSTLAARFSTDEKSRHSGGDLGEVVRTALAPAVESAVFSARAGEVVGPVKTDMGYHLVKVERLMLGALTDALRGSISEHLFTQWLEGEFSGNRVAITLYDCI
ncbi:MAG: peptidylprolyl isomerase [Planctomycetales bacterium]